jgi:V8-like Glu-specific endopeptidase
VVHFLDSLPFDWTAPAARELRDLLADTYFREQSVMQFAADAGVKMSTINWSQPTYLIWHELLEKSRNQGKLRTLMGVISNSADGAVALRLREITVGDPVVAAPLADGHVDEWRGFADRAALERQIESMPALLDIAFLRRGVELAPAVARLLVTFPSGKKYFGTGFRITDDLLLTNHHVLYDVNHGDAPATKIEVWFGYEKDFAGEYLAHDVVMGETGSICGSADHDWAVFRVASAIPDTPVISLSGAAPVDVDDRVYIIQHPNGGAKQIAMIHNVVRHVDVNVVQYWADTQGGSSGSPVFNERWELVALHHRWVTAKASGRTEYRNQGQRIERVATALRKAGVI